MSRNLREHTFVSTKNNMSNIGVFEKNCQSSLVLNQVDKFDRQWLAGLIDGDGYFGVSKKGYASLEITMCSRDGKCLHYIKNIYGGSVKPRSGMDAVRYRLHDKKGITKLVNDLNGLLQNSTRILQFNEILHLYNIKLLPQEPLIYDNSWFSGFFDADGTITINKTNLQLAISVSQKHTQVLDFYKALHGGEVYIDRSSQTHKWYISSKEDILKMVEYFKKHSSRSEKVQRIHLIPKFYKLKELLHANKGTPLATKYHNDFFKCWDKYKVE